MFPVVSNALFCFGFFSFLFFSFQILHPPIQDELREELNDINSKIKSYTRLKSTVGLSKELSVSLVNLRKEKDKLEKTLNRKLSDTKSQAK